MHPKRDPNLKSIAGVLPLSGIIWDVMMLGYVNSKTIFDQVQLAQGTYLACRAAIQVPGGLCVGMNYVVDENKVEFCFAFEASGEDDRLPGYAVFAKLPVWMPDTE